jgi:hypothetical protein
MHSLSNQVLGQILVAERAQAAKRVHESAPLQHPPPVRSRAAYVAARVARRLDSAAARKAVA